MVYTAVSKKSRVKIFPNLRAKNRHEAGPRPIVGRDKCPICRETFTYTPQLDHCHYTGKTRKYLCIGCNTGLGKFYDDSVLLRRCADYIDRHDPQMIVERRQQRVDDEAIKKMATTEANQNLKKYGWPTEFKDFISDDSFWTV
jgi:hypothetical protein